MLGKRYYIFFLIVSLQANISNTTFDQKSSGHPEVGVSQITQEMGGGDSNFMVKETTFMLKIVSLLANISNAFFDQKSPGHLVVGFSQLCAK